MHCHWQSSSRPTSPPSHFRARSCIASSLPAELEQQRVQKRGSIKRASRAALLAEAESGTAAVAMRAAHRSGQLCLEGKLSDVTRL